jgi:hypothetical protein
MLGDKTELPKKLEISGTTKDNDWHYFHLTLSGGKMQVNIDGISEWCFHCGNKCEPMLTRLDTMKAEKKKNEQCVCEDCKRQDPKTCRWSFDAMTCCGCKDPEDTNSCGKGN